MKITDQTKEISNKKEQTKNKIIVVLVSLCVVLSILSVFLLMRINENSGSDKTVQLGEEYYEDYLYSIVTTGMTEEERITFLSSNQELGFRISLADVLRVYEAEGISTSQYEKNGCSLDKTVIYLFPKEPFSQKDVDVMVRNDCNE